MEIFFEPDDDLCLWELPEIVENSKTSVLLNSERNDDDFEPCRQRPVTHEPQVEIQLVANCNRSMPAVRGREVSINYKSVTGSTFVETRESLQVSPSTDLRRWNLGCFRRSRCDALESVILNSTFIRSPTDIPTQTVVVQSEIHFVPFTRTESVASSNKSPTYDDSTVESSSTASSAAALNAAVPIIEVKPEIYEQMERLREMRRMPVFSYRDTLDVTTIRSQGHTPLNNMSAIMKHLSGVDDDFPCLKEEWHESIQTAQAFDSDSASDAESSSIEDSHESLVKRDIVTVLDVSAGLLQSRHVSVIPHQC